MEKAPWKLTVELAEVMGGVGAAPFKRYLDLCAAAFRVARKHYREVEGKLPALLHFIKLPTFDYIVFQRS